MKNKTYCDTVSLFESMEVLQMYMKKSAHEVFRARLEGDEEAEENSAHVCHCLGCAYKWLEDFTEELNTSDLMTHSSFII